MNLKERAKKLKNDIPAVYFALRDRETPVFAKIFAGLTVAYALSPVDLIPDFIPVLGYLDDVILLPLLIAATVKLIPSDVWERSRATAEQLNCKGLMKKWYYALPVIVIWLVIAAVIIKAIFFLICSVEQVDLAKRITKREIL